MRVKTMPIKLSDIEVDYIQTSEYNDEKNTLEEYICSICKQSLELDRRNSYKPVQHKLNHCLKAIVRTIDFVIENVHKPELVAMLNSLRVQGRIHHDK